MVLRTTRAYFNRSFLRPLMYPIMFAKYNWLQAIVQNTYIQWKYLNTLAFYRLDLYPFIWQWFACFGVLSGYILYSSYSICILIYAIIWITSKISVTITTQNGDNSESSHIGLRMGTIWLIWVIEVIIIQTPKEEISQRWTIGSGLEPAPILPPELSASSSNSE